MLSYWRKSSYPIRDACAGWEGKQRRPAHAAEAVTRAEIGRVATF